MTLIQTSGKKLWLAKDAFFYPRLDPASLPCQHLPLFLTITRDSANELGARETEEKKWRTASIK